MEYIVDQKEKAKELIEAFRREALENFKHIPIEVIEEKELSASYKKNNILLDVSFDENEQLITASFHYLKDGKFTPFDLYPTIYKFDEIEEWIWENQIPVRDIPDNKYGFVSISTERFAASKLQALRFSS